MKQHISIMIILLLVSISFLSIFVNASSTTKKEIFMEDDIIEIISQAQYHQEVINQEKQYQQFMEEYLQQKDKLRRDRDFLFPYFSNESPENPNRYITENRVPKPRPLPTGNILYVGGNGTGNYTRIQDAIDNASDGDTVFVYNYSSPYYETLAINNKSIYLIGEPTKLPIIDGQAKYVLTLDTDYAYVEGFTLQNGSLGIKFAYSKNNHISNNNIVSNQAGIWLDYSSDNNVSGNTIINNSGSGIVTSFSSNNTLFNNNIINNYEVGVYIFYSLRSIVIENKFKDNGIIIAGNETIHYNSHIINNNTLNGRPIRYYKNSNDIVVPEDTAQVIMVNCNDCTIQNLNLSRASLGIELTFSKNIHIINNTITNNWCYYDGGGIILLSSSNNILSGNTIANNSNSVVFVLSSNNIVSDHNTIMNNAAGIYIDSASNNIILNNTITKNKQVGILIDTWDNSSYNNTIADNIITNNGEACIMLTRSSEDIKMICSNNTITGNTITNSTFGIDLLISSKNIISTNTITNNTIGIGVYGFLIFGNENTISGNNIINSTWIDIDLMGVSKNTIFDNNITNSSGVGISLESSNLNKILDNYCCSNCIDGIRLYGVCLFNTIENNWCLNNMKGISVRDSIGNILRNNKCQGNEQGILLNNATFTKIAYNDCSHGKTGIFLYTSFLNIISSNKCNDCSLGGITMIRSFFNGIVSNTIKNGWNGLWLEKSFSNLIRNNDIAMNNGVGLILMYTIGNRITHNNIYNSSKYDLAGVLCFDYSRFNYWGGGAPKRLMALALRIRPYLPNPVDTSSNLLDADSWEIPRMNGYSALQSFLLGRDYVSSRKLLEQWERLNMN